MDSHGSCDNKSDCLEQNSTQMDYEMITLNGSVLKYFILLFCFLNRALTNICEHYFFKEFSLGRQTISYF